MVFSAAALAALLFGLSSIVAGDAGGAMDPNGLHARAVAVSDQGTATDPDGRTRAAAPSSDQGGATDPDGLRAR